jgi:preprotein translocase subunit YajC
VNPIIFLGIMLVLVWLLLIMPQRRRQQAQRSAREQVNPGDTILTAGGIYATVREVREHDLTVEIAPGLEVRLDRRAIAVQVPEAEPEEADEADEDDEASEEHELEPAAAHEAEAYETDEHTVPNEEPAPSARS